MSTENLARVIMDESDVIARLRERLAAATQRAEKAEARITKLEALFDGAMQAKEKAEADLSHQSQCYAELNAEYSKAVAARENAEAACSDMRHALSIVDDWDDKPDGPTTQDMLAAVRCVLAHDCGKGCVSKEQLKNTIELEKYSVEMLRNATDGHKEGCICWTCTVMRDIDRDLTRIQKLMEGAQ